MARIVRRKRHNTRLYASIVGLAFIVIPFMARADEGVTVKGGDRIRVTFYEDLGSGEVVDGTEGEGSRPQRVQAIYQKADVSGEYRVESDGAIMVPMLGTFVASGRLVEELKIDLVSAYQRKFGSSSAVAIAFLERAPIYVVGAVRTPGAFTYNSGMIAAHALALAGGLEREQVSTVNTIENIRERDREHASRSRLMQLRARKAALLIQNGKMSKDEARARLQEVTGNVLAFAILDTEIDLAQLRTQVRVAERSISERTVLSGRAEVELNRKRLANIDAQIEARGERLKSLEGLFVRQVVQNERVEDARRDYLEMQGRRREVEMSLLQSEQRLETAKLTLEHADLRYRLDIDNELAQIESEIASLEKSVASSAMIVTTLSDQGCCRNKLLSQNSPTVSYEIMRIGSKGARTISAMETEVLEPGDVVRIGSGSSLEGQRRAILSRQ